MYYYPCVMIVGLVVTQLERRWCVVVKNTKLRGSRYGAASPLPTTLARSHLTAMPPGPMNSLKISPTLITLDFSPRLLKMTYLQRYYSLTFMTQGISYTQHLTQCVQFVRLKGKHKHLTGGQNAQLYKCVA